jgi:hypothetical protein
MLTAARETKPGAQPSAQGTDESYYAMPKSYTIYSLSPTGITVLAYLKQLVILPSVHKAMSQQRPTS